jgi:hypothetical protein
MAGAEYPSAFKTGAAVPMLEEGVTGRTTPEEDLVRDGHLPKLSIFTIEASFF